MDSAEDRRRAAADRKRDQRERESLGLRPVRAELPEEFFDFAVEAGLITEQEADTPEGWTKAIEMVVAEVVRGYREESQSDSRRLSREWVAYPADGAPLTSAEKFAWVQAHGLIGATRAELAQKLSEHGLLARWQVEDDGGEESDG